MEGIESKKRRRKRRDNKEKELNKIVERKRITSTMLEKKNVKSKKK
jgi:hypothetical protein